MAHSWTKAQQSAIEARGKSLMVSAAAGSGKTSVLTQRIVDLLSEEEGVRASALAVVTFTKAAASSLQDKLYHALSEKVAQNPENRALARQLMGLSRAQISTIHSFCYALIRRGAPLLGLPEKVKIAEPARIAPLKKEAIEGAVEEFLAEKNPARLTLCRIFGTARSLAGLYDAVAILLENAASLPGGTQVYRERLEALSREHAALSEGTLSFSECTLFAPVRESGLSLLAKAKGSFAAVRAPLSAAPVLSEKYLPFLEDRQIALTFAENALLAGDPFTCHAVLEGAFPKMPTIRKCPPEEADRKDAVSALYQRTKKELLAFSRKTLAAPLPQILSDWEESLSLTREFLALASLAEDKFRQAKRDEGLLDYSDLENLALSLVAQKKDGVWQKSQFGEEVTGEYDALFVDEYQDSNAIQDLIFRCVTRPDNLFIVGDPKQSIYRFRGAQPEIFSHYKTTLPRYGEEEGTMQAIFLSDNFRSAKPIIDLVNRIFVTLMDGDAPDSLYRPEDALRCRKTGEAPETQLCLLTRKKTEETESESLALSREENLESRYVARRIQALLSHYSPSEIAVICRTKGQIGKVRNSLARLGIPCSSAGEGGLASQEEFLFFTSLLEALDNPDGDIPLLGALLSPVFRFDPDDLLAVRGAQKGGSFYSALAAAAEGATPLADKAREAINLFARLREEKNHLTLRELIFLLYSRLSIAELFSGKNRIKHFFLDCAAMADSAGEDGPAELAAWARDRAQDTGNDDGEDEGVHLLTIHKSKGLEFPVVFVSFLAQSFSRQDEMEKLILSPSLPPAFHRYDDAARIRVNTFLRKSAILSQHKAMLEEEMRVLYVALTRAETRLILTAAPRSLATLSQDLILSRKEPLDKALVRALVKSAKSPLALLLVALRDSPAVKAALAGGAAKEGSLSVESLTLEEEEDTPLPKETEAASSVPDLLSQLAFPYREREGGTLPQKLSVSQLLRMGRQEEASLVPIALPDFDRGQLRPNSAHIGSVTHLVMQFAHFPSLAANPERELARLVSRGFLTPEDASLVDLPGIRAFFDTPLARRMAESRNVVREKRFNVYLPALPLLGRDGKVLVQGVVDAWFEEEGGIAILDFKTDRVREENGEEVLRERHGDQLRLYAMAVSEITGLPVRSLSLYSFSLRREVPIPLKQ